MGEIYRDIQGYEGHYQISNLGNIKSLKRLIKRCNSNKSYFIKERILKQSISNGYYAITLNKNNKQKRFCIHRLVALAFLENPKNKEEVNHKDGNKLNNCVDNLEWCTKSENTLHAYKIGLMIPNNKPKYLF